MLRRMFLGHAFNAGLAGIAFPLLPKGNFVDPREVFDYEQSGRRFHDCVMRAFDDCPRPLPPAAGQTNGLSLFFMLSDTESTITHRVQTMLPMLVRGQEYTILTDVGATGLVSVDFKKVCETLASWMPKKGFVAKVKVDGNWRFGSWRKL